MADSTDYGWSLDESGWPLRLKRNAAPSIDSKHVERVLGVMQALMVEEDPAFGSNRMLLDITINTDSTIDSTISIQTRSTSFWPDQHIHGQEGMNNQRQIPRNCQPLPLEQQLQSILEPWERWRDSIEYIDPHEVTKFSQTKGLAFPKLESSDDVFPLRLFFLLPSGDANSPVHGCLVLSSAARHSCYIAVRHSRGNPSYWGNIFVDGESIAVTKNLEVFLKHMRHPTQCRVLYIRELCVNRHDESERKHFLTGRFHATVENCSCGIVEMNKAMALLDGAGYIAEPPRKTSKDWDGAPSTHSDMPVHMPMILRSHKSIPMDAVEEGLDAEGVGNLPDHEYMPLDIVASEIRILAVYAAKDPADPIIVDIYYVPLHSNVQYHALSYFWGSSHTLHYIRNFMSKIAVTENLHRALVQFRSGIPEGGSPRFIWADAVSINQQDSIEKAHCIPRMHLIYDEAAIVIVYLLSIEGTSKAGALLKFIAESDYDELYDLDTSQDIAGLDDWADLYALFKVPYFTRRWIVQELASASAPSIMIGRQDYRALRSYSLAATLMASKLPELLDAWSDQNHPVFQQHPELRQAAAKTNDQDTYVAIDQVRRVFRRIKTIDFIRSLFKINRPPSFLFLLISTQNAECIDPRDKIYSLWNVAREQSSSSIDISYSCSVEDCYIGFTKAYASMQGSLDIICTSQYPARGNRRHGVSYSQLDLPSWCPDYQQKDLVSSLIRRVFLHYGIHRNASMPELDAPPYHADRLDPADICPQSFRFEAGQLIVPGIVLDTVTFVSEIPQDQTPVHNFFDTVASTWMHNIHTGLLRLPDANAEGTVKPPESPYEVTSIENFHWMNTVRSEEERDALFDAFMSMMIGEPSGSFPGHFTVTGDPASPKWECKGSDVSPLSAYLSYHERAAHVIRGRRLIITEKGYMGLAPWHVREGLKLAILHGCSVPVLLEESQETPGWSFRGDCFVQGWMEGRMLERYASTTQKAWDKIQQPGDFLRIN